MRKQPGVQGSRSSTIGVLSVSPNEGDHSSLQNTFGQAGWMLFTAGDVATASDLLQRHDISVVLCERDLVPGTWIDMLARIQRLGNPPSLIVTSRLADDSLWAEALNLGAWDVVAKPFDPSELTRCVRSAWQHSVSAKPVKTFRAAS